MLCDVLLQGFVHRLVTLLAYCCDEHWVSAWRMTGCRL